LAHGELFDIVLELVITLSMEQWRKLPPDSCCRPEVSGPHRARSVTAASAACQLRRGAALKCAASLGSLPNNTMREARLHLPWPPEFLPRQRVAGYRILRNFFLQSVALNHLRVSESGAKKHQDHQHAKSRGQLFSDRETHCFLALI